MDTNSMPGGRPAAGSCGTSRSGALPAPHAAVKTTAATIVSLGMTRPHSHDNLVLCSKPDSEGTILSRNGRNLMRSISLVLPAVLLFSAFSAAENGEPEKWTRTHNIGIGAGYVTGYGLSYRHWFPSNFGYQVNFAPYYSKTDYEKEITLSLGVTGLRTLHRSSVVNLLGYAGASVYYDYDRYENNYGHFEEVTEESNTRYTIGGGPGFDVHFWHLSMNVMFGVRFSTESTDETRMDITGETAVFYSFD